MNRHFYETQDLHSNFNSDKTGQLKCIFPLSLAQREILLTPIAWKQGLATVPPCR